MTGDRTDQRVHDQRSYALGSRYESVISLGRDGGDPSAFACAATARAPSALATAVTERCRVGDCVELRQRATPDQRSGGGASSAQDAANDRGRGCGVPTRGGVWRWPAPHGSARDCDGRSLRALSSNGSNATLCPHRTPKPLSSNGSNARALLAQRIERQGVDHPVAHPSGPTPSPPKSRPKQGERVHGVNGPNRHEQWCQPPPPSASRSVPRCASRHGHGLVPGRNDLDFERDWRQRGRTGLLQRAEHHARRHDDDRGARRRVA